MVKQCVHIFPTKLASNALWYALNQFAKNVKYETHIHTLYIYTCTHMHTLYTHMHTLYTHMHTLYIHVLAHTHMNALHIHTLFLRVHAN